MPRMDYRAHVGVIFFETVIFVISTHGKERFGSFEETSNNFIGLSPNVRDVSWLRCAARYDNSAVKVVIPAFENYVDEPFSFSWKVSQNIRLIAPYPVLQSLGSPLCICFVSRCLASTCRGIYFDANDVCRNLYETNDVPESDRNQYNPVSFTSSTENLLINGEDYEF